jgi:5-methylthioadenosine/S-adenosylhomocysteine deaminase
VTRRLLIKTHHLITMDPSLGDIAEGEILLDGETIAAIGSDLDVGDADVLDARQLVALPGFVDGHRHTWQSAVRHCAVGWDLATYQATIQGVVGERMTATDAYIGNLLGALSALDAGITTLRDESHVQNSSEHTDALIAALTESGIRACFAYGWPSTDAMSWLWDSDRELPEDIQRVRTDILSDDYSLVTLQALLRGPELSNIEVTRADVARSRDLGLRMSMHMGTGEYGTKYHGIRQLHDAGLIGEDMIFVHCCTSDDDELAMAAAAGASACVTPAVEASMPGLGAPATGRLLAHALRPALGVDVEVGTPGDLFNVMRAALAAERLRETLTATANGEAAEITAHDLLAFATIDGAIAAGLGDRVGSLTPGKQADVILVRTDDLNLVPGDDYAGSLVAAGHAGNVDTVLVAGHVRKQHGKLTHPGVDQIIARGRESRRRLLDHIATPGARA